jgi:diamine N-acetyltransferase
VPTIRRATPDDAEVLARLIRELAAYEKLADEADPDPKALRRQLAPDAQPRCDALLAETAAGETARPSGSLCSWPTTPRS